MALSLDIVKTEFVATPNVLDKFMGGLESGTLDPKNSPPRI